MAERLDIRKTLDDIRTMYKADARQSTFNALVTGNSGTGKTRLLQTCRAPVLVHSFDPGGTKTLSAAISSGRIIPDTRYEQEDYKTPSAFSKWEKEFDRLLRGDVFSQIGTFAIDSLTTFSDAVLHEILRKEGRAGKQMQMQDWGVFLNVMTDILNKVLNVPCDVIMTAHLSITQDQTTGKTESSVLIGGQSKERLPLLFDEVYVTIAKEKAGGIDYKLLTACTGYYRAKTRIGTGKFELYETPDIKALLTKAGLKSADIPVFQIGS